MKTILELIKEAQVVNECGGYIPSSYGCGGGSYYGCGGGSSYYDYEKEMRAKERRAKKIPKDVVLEYQRLLDELKKEKDVWIKASNDADKTLAQAMEAEKRMYGVGTICDELRDHVFSKPVLYKTHTQTAEILKLLTYLLSEEYGESGRDKIDPKTIQALEKIQTML